MGRNGLYFNVKNKKIARRKYLSEDFVQLTSIQSITINPSPINYQVIIEIVKYGTDGCIICGITSESRKNEKFTGIKVKGERELSLCYRIYK